MRLVLTCAALFAAATPAFAQDRPASPEPPVTLQPDADERRAYEASVGSVVTLTQQGDGISDLSVHLYGTVGGDPAINGVYTYIAFFQSPAEGHRVFRIGDFNTFQVVGERKGDITLAITENTVNGDGEIGVRNRRLRVSWTPGADGTPPATIHVTAAP